jgi:hypothetical protein
MILGKCRQLPFIIIKQRSNSKGLEFSHLPVINFSLEVPIKVYLLSYGYHVINYTVN